ncbi:uncharacterized protein [Epargyreus clarus]|uniref:uncharacterized protein isoform X2 n=1 Tax=Epargyreus clarus TaxID=520877 RepID=UPI003C2BAE49
MPELIEQMYCSQQIVIPPKFPYILKRYCKAAIKTQPYDLLRWSLEYFKALAQNRPPPVKLRLEYPIYSTEGGLTRGCLKVLAQQLAGATELPLHTVRAAWQSFCLDQHELRRILCLCQVYLREEVVPFLHFIAVAGGLLTKTLTHTMILLCETLTKEPDGGSAAIPVHDFLAMYKFLAVLDASKDVRYLNGYREGESPAPETIEEEEEAVESIPDTRMEKKLREMSTSKMDTQEGAQKEDAHKVKEQKVDKKKEKVKIIVLDEDDKEIPYEFYGEPKVTIEEEEIEEEAELHILEEQTKEVEVIDQETEKIAEFVSELYHDREDRREDLEHTFDDIAAIVDRFKSANYDLGMVAGRQMSITSGEFIVSHIEKDIMDYINDQIAILPDPDLKKKKAKPEEVAMIRDMLETFLDENMDVIVPEVEEVEEEEQPIPEITVVYAVPGIGPPVEEEIRREFIDYALDVCKVQADVFMPRNIRHFMCPPLEKYTEYKYNNTENKEEVPMGGVITD